MYVGNLQLSDLDLFDLIHYRKAQPLPRRRRKCKAALSFWPFEVPRKSQCRLYWKISLSFLALSQPPLKFAQAAISTWTLTAMSAPPGRGITVALERLLSKTDTRAQDVHFVWLFCLQGVESCCLSRMSSLFFSFFFFLGGVGGL